jgi:hypothetical protein
MPTQTVAHTPGVTLTNDQPQPPVGARVVDTHGRVWQRRLDPPPGPAWFLTEPVTVMVVNPAELGPFITLGPASWNQLAGPVTLLLEPPANVLPEVADHLDQAADRTGDTKTDAINRAITLYNLLQRRIAAGDELLIRTPAGNVEPVQLL